MARARKRLRRQVGLPGAVMIGLGSVLGAGVFVSMGLAAGVAGPGVLAAIVLAGGLALCNGLSSAQLAAAHPRSGATYEFGYRFLHPTLGFTAGWMFLCAKSASAATAALGLAGYILHALPGLPLERARLLATGAVIGLTVLVLTGLRRTNFVNILIVLITLVALGAFVVGGLPALADQGEDHLKDFTSLSAGGVFHATALMFVAFAGYGRIVTLGEEAHHPRRNIPIAVIITVAVTTVLCLAVAVVAVGTVGALGFYYMTEDSAAPLEIIATTFGPRGQSIALIVALGAVSALLGVLLNLILGLSRVVLAMGRRGDLPGMFAHVNRAGTAPAPAVILVGLAIAALTYFGSIRAAWSFSAFTVLIYYGITNLAALRLPRRRRLYPRPFAWLGLGGCIFLAWWVEPIYWLTGVGLIVLGLVWHAVARRARQSRVAS